jgi:hypothetical protein
MLVVAALLAAAGCQRDSSSPAASAKPLALLATGDTAGWLTPCGCAANQSGGLARRATYVRQVKDKRSAVVVDVGGAPGGKAAYDRFKFLAILRGERAMGVVAHNLGAAEVALGPRELRALAKESGVAFVSANARAADGAPLAPALRVVESGGRKLAIVGVLSQQYATDQVSVTEPREAVLAALATAGEPFDSAVVLAYLPEKELERLAAELPEVDVVLGGPTGQSIAPRRLGPTLLSSVTNKGKFLAHLELPADAKAAKWEGQIVELDGKLSDDSGQAAIIAEYRAALLARDFTPAETSFASHSSSATTLRVAGTAACRKCHQDDCTAWEQSKHAHAWQTLVDRRAHGDSYCQQCHTTGYGLAGGFLSVARSPQRANVGCESCHGPSQAHAELPQTRTPFLARDQCLACHDRENSPTFEYAAFWEKIRHGVKVSSQPPVDAAARRPARGKPPLAATSGEARP